MAKPLVTIGIITRNRQDSLRRTLQSITEINYQPFEVIIADNSSTDQTRQVIEEFGFKRVTTPLHFGFSKTRQAVIELAKGDIIAWCDDDCVPEPQWLDAFVDTFSKDQNVGIVAGKIINYGFPPELKHKGTQRVVENGKLKVVEDPFDADCFANLNMAQSRIAMQKIGGYDPVFIGGYEEVDLVYSMRKMGFKVVFNSDAVVHHFHNLIAFKKGRLIYGGTLMRLHFYFKHKAKIGNSDFVKNEFKLFREEFIRNFRLLISSLFKLNLNKIQISIIELFNAVFARLAIPYIVFRYKNSN